MSQPLFEAYPNQPSSPENGFPMTKPEDYDFSDGFEQPLNNPFPTQEAQPGQFDPIDPDMSDFEVNRAIVGASALAVRSAHSSAELSERVEHIPSTYGREQFVKDSNAVSADGALCSAWLELYLHQVKSGDYPRLTEIRRVKNQGQRLAPRRLTEKLPDGSAAEDIEIFLTPELYKKYLESGLLPSKPGGLDGIPCIYWIRHDGPANFIAGTNATKIYRTNDMKVITSATPIGTNNSVKLVLAAIPERPNIEAVRKNINEQTIKQQTRRDWHPRHYYDGPSGPV